MRFSSPRLTSPHLKRDLSSTGVIEILGLAFRVTLSNLNEKFEILSPFRRSAQNLGSHKPSGRCQRHISSPAVEAEGTWLDPSPRVLFQVSPGALRRSGY